VAAPAQLFGSDTEWIAQLLETHEISPDEVLASYDGTQPDVPVEALAKLLVPSARPPGNARSRPAHGCRAGR
jgi:hypothetical protein